MGLRKMTGLIAAAIVAWPGNGEALGGFVEEFTDKDEWIAAVGRFTTIGFTGFPDGTFITDQYADLGILFTDGNDSINFSPTAFPNDAWGLDGNGNISVSFDTPQAWIGVDHPGFHRIELYSDGRLLFASNTYGGGGAGFFLGLVSSELFDAAVLIDPGGEAEIDDLHFGVPTPGALWLLGIFGDIRDSHLFTSWLSSLFKVCSPSC
ncbi:MAG: hypothetical protein IH889_02875, partial [Planctomycetes bacterium]|nr:hypothetical protein [Planctomycetota bacterium]